MHAAVAKVLREAREGVRVAIAVVATAAERRSSLPRGSLAGNGRLDGAGEPSHRPHVPFGERLVKLLDLR